MEKDVRSYDPGQRPSPEWWLALNELERIDRALRAHRRVRLRLPNVKAHATIHVVVENQVVLGDKIPVRRTLERLQAEGLDRHEAVHAVGSILAKHLYDLMKGGAPNEAYLAELEDLTAEGWKRPAGF